MELSLVIPLLNEASSLGELHQWIDQVMQDNNFSYELVFIDDGSTDDSWEVIQKIGRENPFVKGIRFRKNYGKSQALNAAFKEVSGDVIITMDADLQDNPEEIPELYRLIREEEYELVSGWKKKRYDSVLAKNLPSKLFNAVARQTSGLSLHDFNCGLKAYHGEVVKNIDVYGEMHRYIPILVKNAGYPKITEKVVQHQKRKFGKTKFGANRFTHGFLDLISIWFLTKFARRPMHLFGALGGLMLIIGFFTIIYIGVSKLYKIWNGIPEILITQNPWFYIALTVMILGTLLFVAGFLGELILRTQTDPVRYKIKSKSNLE